MMREQKGEQNKLLWITHAPLDLPGYRSTQFGMAMGLVKNKWKVKFFTKEHKKGKEPPKPFLNNTYFVTPSKNRIITEIKLLVELFKAIDKYKPDILLYEAVASRYVIPVFIYVKLFLYTPKLILDTRTPPISKNIFGASIAWSYWIGCLILARIFTTATTAISEPLADFVNIFVGRRKNSIIWSSGVDEGLFNPAIVSTQNIPTISSTDIIIIYHGSLALNRGLPELVEAFAKVEKDQKNIKLILLGGDNRIKKKLEYIYRESGGGGNLLLLDTVENSSVPNFIAAADFGVCPLPNEWRWQVSSPLKVYEYLAMGKPVLATGIAAHNSVIMHKKNGILIKNSSVEELSNGIRLTIRNIDELKKYTLDHRSEVISQYSWTSIAYTMHRFMKSQM